MAYSGSPGASDPPAGFRAQQRFSDPSETVPPEWTAPTPPRGIPLAPLQAAAAQLAPSPPVVPVEPAVPLEPAVPANFFDPGADLSSIALLGQPKRKPSHGWRRWLYLASE